MSKIKICGLRREIDIEYANELNPDFVGFIFAGKKREIDFKTAAKLKSKLNNNIKSVGVFVNKDIKSVAKAANEGIIDLIQLHGDEDLEYINSLRLETKAPIIKAVRVSCKEDILNALDLPVDHLLLDAYVAGGSYGGTGKRFDTNLIPPNLDNYFLAGGLNAENLEEVIKTLHPYAIDLSSSLEDENNYKVFEKMKEVVEIVRSNG